MPIADMKYALGRNGERMIGWGVGNGILFQLWASDNGAWSVTQRHPQTPDRMCMVIYGDTHVWPTPAPEQTARLFHRTHGDYEWIMENDATRYCCGPQDCHAVVGEVVERPDGSALAQFEHDGALWTTLVPAEHRKLQPLERGITPTVCVQMYDVWTGKPGDIVRGRCLFMPPSVF